MTIREKVARATENIIARWHGDAGSIDPTDSNVELIFEALGIQEGGPNCIVPRQPTEAMLQALFVLPDMVGGHIVRHSIDKLPAAYRAMISAGENHD